MQFGPYRTLLVALFCGSLLLAVCILVLGCRQRWMIRRRRLRREQKLRQQSKHQRHDSDAGSCHLMVCDRPPKDSSKMEVSAVCGAPLSNCAVSFSRSVCHCLPRGLRRKSPATAVIRRGRSVESLPVDRRPSSELTVKVPRLTHAASLAVLQQPGRTGSRPDLVHISTPGGSTSGAERWKPITVAGETTFPVQPSAAIFLSLDVDESVRYKRREPQEM